MNKSLYLALTGTLLAVVPVASGALDRVFARVKFIKDFPGDTTPNYTGTTPVPSPSTIWKYRAIFHVNGTPNGVWSETLSVVAGG